MHLLSRSASEPVDPFLARQIADETVGNPLALIDLAREYTARELTDSSIAPAPLPVGPRLESHYLRQLDAVPPAARRWLQVAAAESSGDAVVIDKAAARLGLSGDVAADAERAGLASVRDTVTFRHPLVRSAVYGSMAAAERRRVHAALRDVADQQGREDLAVWHAAAAVLGTDDAVAARLERAADAAGGRGGSASRARLLARSADLTSAGPVRDGRLVQAAEAAAGAGAAQLALELLDRVDLDHLDPVGVGRTLSLRALLALFVADPAGVTGGAAMMLRAADLFHGVAPELEQRALVHAFELTLTAEWAIEGVTLPELGRRLEAGAAVADGPLRTVLLGLGAHVLRPYEEAVPRLRAALDVLRDADDAQLLELGFFGIAVTMALWDERACIELLERTARAARDAGSLRVLDTNLWLLSLTELVRGDPAAGGRYVEQVRDLRRAIGYDAEQVVNASYLAWAGAPPEVGAAGGRGGPGQRLRRGLDRGDDRAEHPGDRRRSLPRRVRAAAADGRAAVPAGHVPAAAGLRGGRRAQRAPVGGPRGRGSAGRVRRRERDALDPGVSARCAALLAEDDTAEAHYRQASSTSGGPRRPVTWAGRTWSTASGCGARDGGARRASSYDWRWPCSTASRPPRSPTGRGASSRPPASTWTGTPPRTPTA